jgi:hypothetical protein
MDTDDVIFTGRFTEKIYADSGVQARMIYKFSVPENTAQ